MGLGVFVMVPLRDDLDAENIRDGYTLPIRHLDHAVDRVDPLDLSGDSLVAAAVLPFVRHKVVMETWACWEAAPGGAAIPRPHAPFRTHPVPCAGPSAARFPQWLRCGRSGRQRVKTAPHGHRGTSADVWRIRMGQMNDVIVLSVHALCPPICLFRSLAVAPSR